MNWKDIEAALEIQSIDRLDKIAGKVIDLNAAPIGQLSVRKLLRDEK